MSALPARRGEQGGMLAEGTEAEIRAIIRKTGGTAKQGVRLPGDRLRVHITMPPADASDDASVSRWWQGRSWKFWTPVAGGAALAFGSCLVAAVIVLKALIAAVVVIATMALGAAIVSAMLAALGMARGGGTWTGSGTWR